MTADGLGAEGRPRRSLYGRSRGKALRPGQERLLADALPRIEAPPDELGRSSLFPFEPREVWLEIGFGSGEHLIDQADVRIGHRPVDQMFARSKTDLKPDLPGFEGEQSRLAKRVRRQFDFRHCVGQQALLPRPQRFPSAASI